MAAIIVLLGIFCFAVTDGYGQHQRYLLTAADASREQLVQIALKEVGVRELTGHNDGPRVEAYLRIAGLKKGQPWCAAFISWVFYTGGYLYPRSGWTPALFPAARLSSDREPGNLLAIYFPELKRIAHVGLIVRQQGNWLISAEGNTNLNGSREGDGVYLKRRHRRTIYSIADWISAAAGTPEKPAARFSRVYRMFSVQDRVFPK